jgi:hypothetical protein
LDGLRDFISIETPTTKEHRSKTQSKTNSSIIKLEKLKQDPFASSWGRVPIRKKKETPLHTVGALEPDFFAPSRSKLIFQGMGMIVGALAGRSACRGKITGHPPRRRPGSGS